jgi:hypothetical protein
MKFITIEHKDGEIVINSRKIEYISKGLLDDNTYIYWVKYMFEGFSKSRRLTEDQYMKVLKQLNNINKSLIAEEDFKKLTPDQLEKIKHSIELGWV